MIQLSPRSYVFNGLELIRIPLIKFESAIYLVKLTGEKSISVLRELLKRNLIQYSLEALCAKNKYKDLVLDVRNIAIKKIIIY